ncbi:DUF3306 domain-containing protein [Pseudoduganella chitinolytica]|uniref:DUF3306 domain-containing protein n=1 Tax=Pseudoduganella chitinolytica TaxID=34070 RepID=A0ABY8BJV5_9BURK|nr:DUF3306 domain-containing protein [Pseudoduganella chitinolytica]WEF35196.1 DUF3306 domain-containing protein [Pseudoduganella chitinolytica]
MAAETFFARWSRRKVEAAEAAPVAVPELATAAPVDSAVIAEPAPVPTLEQVAQLQQDGDFRPFVARGVDEGVRRAAMKKLFADPQFNVMDGLDIYIDDYSKSDPIPAAMLLAMNHAKDLLDPLGTLARERAKRGLLTAAERDVESVVADAAPPELAPTMLPKMQAEPQPESDDSPEQEAPTANAAADDSAAPSHLDPAERQEDHEHPNQSM